MTLKRLNLRSFILFFGSQILLLYLIHWNNRSSLCGHENDGQEEYIKRLPEVSAYTDKRKYAVHYFYKSEGFGIENIDTSEVTLGLHGTVDVLFNLIDIADKWSGPISIAIFAPGLDSSFYDDAIDGLRMCWRGVRQRVSFHLVYPTAFPGNVSDTGSFVYMSCRGVVVRLKKAVSSHKGTTYPHNIMRNVAHKGTLTDFVLHIDGSIALTPGLHNSIKLHMKDRDFKETGSSLLNLKRAFVIPVFELEAFIDPIGTKDALLQTLADGSARPLFQESCRKCQGNINFSLWMKLKSKAASPYIVQYKSGWEPFYVVSRNSPKYDEKFTAYGYDRLKHACELNAEGYTFEVLPSSFLTMKRFRTKARLKNSEYRRFADWEEFHNRFRQVLSSYGFAHEKFDAC